MKKLRFVKTLSALAVIDQGVKQYYKAIEQELPYYNPYKVVTRFSRNVYTGLRLVSIYSPEYKSTGTQTTYRELFRIPDLQLLEFIVIY